MSDCDTNCGEYQNAECPGTDGPCVMQKQELRSCPFCGEHLVEEEDGCWSHDIDTELSCVIPRLIIDGSDFELWNTRAEDPVKAELVEALEEMLQHAYNEDWDMGKIGGYCVESAEAALAKAKGGK